MNKKILLPVVSLIVFFITYAYGEDYNVNFKNVPMKDFITFVSEFTGKNVIFNESDIKGNVTVNSQKDMDAKEILEIFYSVLKLNGYIPIVQGDSIQIIPEKDMPAFDEDVSLNNAGGNSYVTSVISLNNYNAATLLPVLNRMKSRTGYVEAVKGLNIIVVRDSSSRIDKMTTVVKRIDRAADSYEFHTLQLQYSIASKVEQQIMKLYNELAKNSINATTPIVVADDISNTLIIAATPKDYNRIKYIVANVDSKNMAVNTEPRVFYLKNSKAEDVEKVLSKLAGSLTQTANGTGTASGTASTVSAGAKASISSDNSTNAILAIGNKELYDNLEALISKIDIPRRQVYVEALILETTIDKSSEFGVEWFTGGGSDNGAILGGSTGSGALGGLLGPILQGGSPSIASLGTGLSLGVIGNIISFQGAKFPSISALISAVRSSSGINIISNPQILTLNNSEAEVFVGENIPYQTSTKYDSNNNPIQTFDYRDVGVKLKVTPQISSNNMVTLTIEQEIKKVSGSAVDATAPTTLTRNTKTTVKLENHSIMVISGMIKDDTTFTKSGVPVLSQIPILGWLFKRSTTSIQKTNVMLFITAHIIDTLDDNEKLLSGKRATMEDFNRQGDKEFNKGAFTDTGRSIQLKNEIEGLTPEEAKKTQAVRDKEKAAKEKAEKKAEKERQKAIKKAEKEAKKSAQGSKGAKPLEENPAPLTPKNENYNITNETEDASSEESR